MLNPVLPAVSIGVSEVYTTGRLDIHLPGTNLYYADINYTFLVDDTLDNYLAIVDWLKRAVSNPAEAGSIIQLQILGIDGKPIKNIVIEDAYPIALTEIEMDAANNDSQETATVTFKLESWYCIEQEFPCS